MELCCGGLLFDGLVGGDGVGDVLLGGFGIFFIGFVNRDELRGLMIDDFLGIGIVWIVGGGMFLVGLVVLWG